MAAHRLKLLSIGHSYCVALNRRLLREISLLGRGRWEVTVVAPMFVAGDLRPINVELDSDPPYNLVCTRAYLTRRPQIMFYGRLIMPLLRERWDILHCWEEPYVVSAGEIARCANHQSALVFYTFQNIAKKYPPPFKWIESYVFDRCSAWIAAGASVREARLQCGYGSKLHTTLPLGVDTERFAPDPAARSTVRAWLGWENEKAPVVGFLGRFVEEKGLRMLMESLEALRNPWKALFVGAGPLEPVLRRWSNANLNRVRVITNVKHDEVPAYLNAMDILCAPSQTRHFWKEQQGRMLIEAFATGVPVIASDSGEIPHVVNSAGIIVPECDTQQWSNAIDTLLADSTLRAELRMRGLDRVHAIYALPVIAREHLSFFEKVLAKKDRRSI